MVPLLQVGPYFFDPTSGTVTIPGGIYGLDAQFVPNYDRSPLGAGYIEFDAEICKSNIPVWEHDFDFSASTQGFTAGDPDTEYGACPTTQWCAGEFFTIVRSNLAGVSGMQIVGIRLDFDTYGPRDFLVQLYDDTAAAIAFSDHFNSGDPEAAVAWTFINGHDYTLRLDCQDNAGVSLSHVFVRGAGSDPF